jgi:hypothetical protein
MQKNKFDGRCSGTLFMETTPGPPKHEKYCLDLFPPWMHKIALHDPQIPPDAKTKIWRNLSRRFL